MFVDYSRNVYDGGFGVSLQQNCRVRLPILLGWFESLAMQNIQAFFNDEISNVNDFTKYKPNFILGEF